MIRTAHQLRLRTRQMAALATSAASAVQGGAALSATTPANEARRSWSAAARLRSLAGFGGWSCSAKTSEMYRGDSFGFGGPVMGLQPIEMSSRRGNPEE